MTRKTIRLSAAALGSAALLAVAGCGGSAGSTTTAPSASAQGAPQQARAGGPFNQANLSTLAKELGVTTARLQQALAAARPPGAPNGAPNGAPPGGARQGSGRPPGGAGGPGGRIAANLAKQLNLPEAKVQQALAKVLPGRGQGAAPQAPSTNPGTSSTPS